MEKETYSLERILNDIRANGLETKTLNGIFIDIIGCMGLDSNTLKDDNGRYHFSQTGFDFWVKALMHYSDPPYSLIREKKFEKLEWPLIQNFLTMLKEAMMNAGKSYDEINAAFVRVDAAINYSKSILEKEFQSCFKAFMSRYIDILDSKHFLTFCDRIVLVNHAKNEILQPYLQTVLECATDFIEYFEDERLSEAQEAALFTTTDTIVIADQIADSLAAKDKDIQGLLSKFSSDETELRTKAKVSGQVHLEEKILNEKKKLQKSVDAALGILPQHRHFDESSWHKTSKDILNDAIAELEPNKQ